MMIFTSNQVVELDPVGHYVQNLTNGGALALPEQLVPCFDEQQPGKDKWTV